MEASPIQNMDIIVHSQPTDTCINETTETDSNSTLLDDGTLFSSHTVDRLIDREDNGQNNNHLMITIMFLMIPLATKIITRITNTNNL